jgi:hypothetical protein
MRRVFFHSQLVLAACMAAALPACSSGAGGSGMPAAPAAVSAGSPAQSWIDSKASKGTLLYVSDPGTATVGVFTFPKGRRIGTLKGFTQPMGECVDLSGNLYVTDKAALKIYEFAHGKSKPIQIIDTTPYAPYKCAFNLHGGDQTGYLAHVNAPDTDDPSGSVTILGAGHGDGQLNMTRQFSSIGYICYDQHQESANLWLDGLNYDNSFQMAYFHVHRKKFNDFPFPNSLAAPGDVWWDGKLLDIADQSGTSGASIINRYEIAGDVTLAGTIDLSQQVAQFVTGDSILVGSVTAQQSVQFWNYPAGGSSVRTLTGFAQPFGVAISPVLPQTRENPR